MNKEQLLREEMKNHYDQVTKFHVWIEEEEELSEKIREFIDKLPSNFIYPKQTERGMTSLTFIYPLDKKLITKVKRSFAIMFPEIQIGDVNIEWGSQASFSIHLEGFYVFARFSEFIEGSTCKLVKIGEQKTERVENVYSMECV